MRALIDVLAGIETRYLNRRGFQTRQYSVKSGDVVVEFGAYLGYYTISLAEEVGPEGRVHAVEIIPAIHKVLARNLEANFPDRASSINRGVWSQNSTKRALWVPRGPGGGFTPEILLRFGSPTEIEVRADSVDSILEEFGVSNVDLLIVQLNGSEIEAVQGMSKAFALCKNMVITSPVRGDSDSMSMITESLRSRGFRVTTRGNVVYGTAPE
jgi:FkbM family methyltransferase